MVEKDVPAHGLTQGESGGVIYNYILKTSVPKNRRF
jgi:hypothetical protein